MIKPVVTIIDYGMGNMRSVCNALAYLGADFLVSADPKAITSADLLILPGVGSFRQAASALQQHGLDDAIHEAVIVRHKKILGICLGMQLLCMRSTEGGECAGLGLVAASVDRFSESETCGGKIPHIGFNVVTSRADSTLFSGLNQRTDFYFVHSYRLLPHGLPGFVATCDYGVRFVAAYENDNICATQFHPEKSQTSGLRLLQNFLTR